MPTRPESRSDARPATAVPVAARTGPALALAVLGSVVGAVFTTRLGHAGECGALAGAELVPVVSRTFTTRLAGERGGVRATAIFVLSAAALAITVTGFTFTEIATGRPVIGGEEGTTTCPVSGVMRGTGTSGASTPTQGPTPVEPTVEAEVHVYCAVAAGTCVATVASAGEEALGVTSVVTADDVLVPVVDPTEPSGPTEPWTVAADECLGAFLEQGQSCQVVAVAAPDTVGPGPTRPHCLSSTPTSPARRRPLSSSSRHDVRRLPPGGGRGHRNSAE